MRVIDKLKVYIHKKNTGPIYLLRIFHGKIVYIKMQMQYTLLPFKYSKDKSIVATSLGGDVYGDNPAYIIEKIHELDPTIKLIWLVAPDAKINCPEYINLQVNNDINVLRLLAKASVIIDNDRKFLNWHSSKRSLIIQTWHGGLGIKNIGYNSAAKKDTKRKKEKRLYDFYISDSEHISRVYRSAFCYHGPIWRCGYPLEDELYIEYDEKIKIREKYRLTHDTKIILYAPTFREMYDWNCKLQPSKIIDAFKRRFGGKWILAIHWHPNLKGEMLGMPDAVDMSNWHNMQSLIKASNAFISDYSSSIFQAVQIDIPCFIYADDFKQYQNDRDLCYPLEELPFPYAFTNEELVKNIVNYEENIWRRKWKIFQNRMGHIVTGHSAEDIAKVCVEFINGKTKKSILKELEFEDF